MPIKIEVWGDYACFTRPEMKAERVSYDVMTPSAARGILEAIYWHPGMRYHIDRIHVLNPVRFTNIRRNEVGSKASATKALAAFKSGEALACYASKDRQQRASRILRDVHYVIEAHFTMTDKAAQGDNPGKFQDILRRRLLAGRSWNQPYFGCREFPTYFRMWEGGEIPAVPVTEDLGRMFYDMDYSNPENIKPQFFFAKMVNGVIDVSNCEVFR